MAAWKATLRCCTAAVAAAFFLGPTLAIAQAEPDYFAGVEDATPLTEADVASPPPTKAEVLRWRAPQHIVNPYVTGSSAAGRPSAAAIGSSGGKTANPIRVDRNVVQAAITLSAPHQDDEKPAAAAQTPRVAAAPRAASGSDWNRTRISGHAGPARGVERKGARPVRLAGHDPFSDPFGDKLAQGEEPELSAPLNVAAQASQPPSAEPPSSEPPPAEPRPDALPPPTVTPGSERTYDPAICESWAEQCERFKERLRADKITSISLNIAPLYTQPSVEGEDAAEFRQRELADTPSRQWRSKTGELLATGRLANVEYGRVVIADDAGREIARPTLRELGQDEICYVKFHWNTPNHCYADAGDAAPRNWLASTFTYQASNLCHKPLYFEQVQLERYGHTAGPIKQPILSGAHFFANIAVLPYKMAINPPLECQYSLGYYRPGSCAPWHIPPVPISVRGALAEAGVWIGGIYMIP